MNKLWIKIAGSAVAGGLVYVATLPECAAMAPVLSGAAMFILGALHIPRPGDSATPKS